MKLEVGKHYRDKAGRECEVFGSDGIGLAHFLVRHTGEGRIYHYEDGRANIGGDFDLVEEIKPTTRFKVGETYRTRTHGDNYKCISVNDDGSAHLAFDARTPAYVWDADGRSLSLSSEWDIVFQPVVETKHHAVTVEGNRLTIVYKVIDGKPDTDNAQLVPF